MLRTFEDLSRNEVEQVFDGAANPPAIRSLDEQKAWLHAKKLAEQRQARREKQEQLVHRPGKYRIEGKLFYPDPKKTKFTLKELETAIEDMRRLHEGA